MIINLALIKPLLEFTSKDDFYLLEIIQRKKENPGLNKNARVIKTYTISSIEQLDSTMDELIKLCEVFNARAGIRLNKRSFKTTALDNLRKLTAVIISGEYPVAKNQYYKAAGSSKDRTDKKWIIDLDENDLLMYNDIKSSIKRISRDAILAEIPSKTGIHLITKPFNRIEFNYPIEIHKDNPTNLIIPN
jgi:hypothetical protein